jgi:acyl carrier protein
MQRRKFIKSTLAAATIATLSPNLNAFAATTTAFTPRKFTREEIEKGVKSLFSKNRIGKNAKFEWGSHFIKDLGMDSLDTVEVIMDAEQMFHCSITDNLAVTMNTPRDLANLLQNGLNNAVVYYYAPDFKGEELYLFPEKEGKSEFTFNYVNYGQEQPQPQNGSVYKPKEYGLTCIIGEDSYLVAAAGKKWETNNLLNTLAKITKKKAATLLKEQVLLVVTNDK